MLKTANAPSNRKKGLTAKEQRLAERYGLKTTVLYTPSSDAKQRRKPGCSATTINASKSGMCIQTQGVLLPAQIIRLEIPTQNGQTTSPTLAEVCWVTKTAGVRQAGLRFLL